MRHRFLPLAASILFLATAAAATAQNHPFGSHPIPYAAGTIQPNHVSAAILDSATRDFYDAWKAEYVTEACGAGLYVVQSHTQPGNLTISEAHGYGMILTALMAGHDPQAREIFDGMFAYFRQHPTLEHDRLMAWNQNTGCNNVEGDDSASDGDLDIAYALLLADKQWGSCGAIDYHAEALAVLADIKDGELDSTGEYVLLGNWVQPSDTTYYPSTRTSDFMPSHFASFFAATADSTWNAVRDRAYSVVDAIQTNHSPATGLLPDFVVHPATTPQPAGPMFLEGPNDGAYDYNACRDPWRLALDFVLNGDTRSHDAVQAINTFFRTSTSDDPLLIRSGYQLDGTVSPGADYLSMAFVAPLAVGAMVDASNQGWLNSLWDRVLATPIEDSGYYENTLKLLALLTLSNNWWAPEMVGGGCTANTTAICTNGSYLLYPQIGLSGLAKAPGQQGLKIKGQLFFPNGVPTSDFTAGAQVLVEDLGSGGATVYEMSSATFPIPAAATGSCDESGDKWKLTSSSATYTNRSGAIDPPTCTPSSANGFRKLKLKPIDAQHVGFQLAVKHTAFSPPVGPLRATLVLGAEAADGLAGQCGISAAVACTSSASSMRCR